MNAELHAPTVAPEKPRGFLSDPSVTTALWVIALMTLGSIAIALPARMNQLDFSHYYSSSLLLRQGSDPYRVNLTSTAKALGLEVDENIRATYPPTFLLCFEPLTLMPPARAYGVWIAFNAAMMCVALTLLLAGSRFDPATALSLAALAIIFPAFLDTFDYAQSHPIILMLLVLTMRSLKRGMDRAAGIALAVAALLRGFPIIMIAYLIARRRWRAIESMIVALAVGAAITIAVVGMRTALDFGSALSFITDTNWLRWPANVSLNAFISRMFGYMSGLPPGAAVDRARRAIGVMLEIALFSITLRATSVRSEEVDSDPDFRNFSLWVVATILLAPTAWLHYLVLLFIPYEQIISAWIGNRASPRAFRMMLASYLSITGILLFANFMGGRLPLGVFLVVREVPFVALTTAYIAAMWFVVDRRAIA